MKKLLFLLIAVMFTAVLLTGCETSGQDDQVCINVGKETVTVGELKYYIDSLKKSTIETQSAEEQEAFWATEKDGKKPEEYIRDTAVENITSFAVNAALAREKGLTVSNDEVNSRFKSIPAEDLKKLKTENKMTESTIKAILKKSLLAQKYNDRHLSQDPRLNPTDEAMKKIFEEKYIKAQHILILTTGEDQQTPLPDAEKAVKKQEIEALLVKARTKGVDFKELMLDKSEDPGSKSQPDGYVFTDGEMVLEFYQTALATKENEISDVVETTYGYHIIKRLPLNLTTDFEANSDKVSEMFRQVTSEEIINELKGTLEIKQKDELIKAIPIR